METWWILGVLQEAGEGTPFDVFLLMGCRVFVQYGEEASAGARGLNSSIREVGTALAALFFYVVDPTLCVSIPEFSRAPSLPPLLPFS